MKRWGAPSQRERERGPCVISFSFDPFLSVLFCFCPFCLLVSELYSSLAKLIVQNPNVKRWMIKIDSEFGGRGTAYFDPRTLKVSGSTDVDEDWRRQTCTLVLFLLSIIVMILASLLLLLLLLLLVVVVVVVVVDNDDDDDDDDDDMLLFLLFVFFLPIFSVSGSNEGGYAVSLSLLFRSSSSHPLSSSFLSLSSFFSFSVSSFVFSCLPSSCVSFQSLDQMKADMQSRSLSSFDHHPELATVWQEKIERNLRMILPKKIYFAISHLWQDNFATYLRTFHQLGSSSFSHFPSSLFVSSLVIFFFFLYRWGVIEACPDVVLGASSVCLLSKAEHADPNMMMFLLFLICLFFFSSLC